VAIEKLSVSVESLIRSVGLPSNWRLLQTLSWADIDIWSHSHWLWHYPHDVRVSTLSPSLSTLTDLGTNNSSLTTIGVPLIAKRCKFSAEKLFLVVLVLVLCVVAYEMQLSILIETWTESWGQFPIENALILIRCCQYNARNNGDSVTFPLGLAFIVLCDGIQSSRSGPASVSST